MAFSPESRAQIGERDGGPLGSTSYDFGMWEASHIDHNKADDHYDDPSNGVCRNRPTHYLEHAYEADHGFSYHQWAANKIYERLTDDERAYLEWLDTIE